MNPRRTRRAVTAMVTAFLLMSSATASAKLSKQQREELQGYVTKLQAVQDPEAQQAVLYLRGILADKAAQKEIAALKSNEDARTRLAATIALLLAGEKKADEAVAAEIEAQGGAYGLLRMSVAPVEDRAEAEVLKELLDGAKPELRQEVFRYLAEQRGDLFELLAGALEDKDPTVRAAAAQALVAARRFDVLGAAQKLLTAKDEGVRQEALNLVVAFSRHDKAVDDAKKALQIAAKDKSAAIRERAARRLLELKEASAAKVLLDVAGAKEKPEETAAILDFLVDHDAKPKFAEVEKWLASENASVKLRAHQLAAASGDKKFVDKLLEMYGSTEFDDRLLAVQSLGRSSDPRALTPLQSSLFEMRDDIRLAAAQSLREYAKPAALAPLGRALDGEKNKDIKLAVIDAIGAVGGKDALQVLRFQVTNSDIDHKKRVIEAIRAMKLKEGAKALDVLLRDRNTDVQWKAFLAALSLDEAVAKPSFASVFRNPPSGFMDDLAKLDPARRKTIYTYLLKEGSGSVREKVAEQAMETGEFEAVLYDLALDSAVDSSLRRTLIHHFGNRGSAKDLAVLERIARGKDPSMARQAAWMLTRHPSKGLEASYRGYLASKDETLNAIAAYGLATVWR